MTFKFLYPLLGLTLLSLSGCGTSNEILSDNTNDTDLSDAKLYKGLSADSIHMSLFEPVSINDCSCAVESQASILISIRRAGEGGGGPNAIARRLSLQTLYRTRIGEGGGGPGSSRLTSFTQIIGGCGSYIVRLTGTCLGCQSVFFEHNSIESTSSVDSTNGFFEFVFSKNFFQEDQPIALKPMDEQGLINDNEALFITLQ